MIATCSLNNAFRSRVMRGFLTAAVVVFGVTMVFLAQPAVAIIVVNDTWKDGTRNDPAPGATGYSENGVDSDADGDIESAWFMGTGMGNATLSVAGSPGGLTPPAPVVGSPNLLHHQFASSAATGSASLTTYFKPEGSEVNLANAGDKILVTWAFKLTTVNATNGSQSFRFGLVDSVVETDPLTARVSTDASPTAMRFRGYAIWGNMGQTLGNSNPFQLRRRTLDSGNLLNTSGDFGDILGNGATAANPGYVADTLYTMTWEITRNESNGLDHIVKMVGGTDPTDLDGDGEAIVMFTDASPVGPDVATAPFGSYKYDTFAIRPSNATQNAEVFDTSLFKVEFFTNVVPPVLAGDYNNNNVVDAADYVLWRENNGTNNTLPNDPIGGTIDVDQYNQWKANFGKTPGAGSALVRRGSRAWHHCTWATCDARRGWPRRRR